MVRYYFDCFDGTQLLMDVHGIELSGIHEVADEAVALAAKLLTEELGDSNPRNVFVSVRGEEGAPVYCAHGGFVGRYTDNEAAVMARASQSGPR